MSPREKGRFLKKRGWEAVGTLWTGVRTWRDPRNPWAGSIATNEAYDREVRRTDSAKSGEKV